MESTSINYIQELANIMNELPDVFKHQVIGYASALSDKECTLKKGDESHEG